MAAVDESLRADPQRWKLLELLRDGPVVAYMMAMQFHQSDDDKKTNRFMTIRPDQRKQVEGWLESELRNGTVQAASIDEGRDIAKFDLSWSLELTDEGKRLLGIRPTSLF